MIGAQGARAGRCPIEVAAIGIAATAILATGLLTLRSVTAGPDNTASPSTNQYLPSISDLMMTTIQPRHERIWQAEQNGDWKFAAYELGNLQGAFKRLGIAHPRHGDISLPEMIASVTEQPFRELDDAIKAKDSVAFHKAYSSLTDACNSCHQALNHDVVAIHAPDRTSPSDPTPSTCRSNDAPRDAGASHR